MPTLPTRALQGLQKAGYTVIGLAANSGKSLQDLDPAILGGNIVIVVGSEGQGLGRLVSETCDWLVGIDMDSKTESLNAAVATSIALHAASLARLICGPSRYAGHVSPIFSRRLKNEIRSS
jgi:23S rRNA (guanosine2251-2'-O)-methyltransferase